MNTIEGTRKCLMIILLSCLVSNGLSTSVDVSQFKLQPGALHGVTRDLINKLVAHLQHSGAKATESIANFTIEIGKEKRQFTQQLLLDINHLRASVRQAVDDAVAKGMNVSTAVNECVENERQKAEELFSNTAIEVTECVIDAFENIANQLSDLTQLGAEAMQAADVALQKTQECGASGKVFAVAACLTGVLVETQLTSATIAGEIAILIARIGLTLESLPVTLPVCAGAQLAEAALEAGKLLLEIAKCAAAAVIAPY